VTALAGLEPSRLPGKNRMLCLISLESVSVTVLPDADAVLIVGLIRSGLTDVTLASTSAALHQLLSELC